jgi:hypothetical protein
MMLRITLEPNGKYITINRHWFKLLEKDSDGLLIVSLYTKESFNILEREELKGESCFSIVEKDFVNLTAKIMIYV